MMRSEGFAPTAKLVWRAASLRCSNLPFDIIDTGFGNRLPLKHEGTRGPSPFQRAAGRRSPYQKAQHGIDPGNLGLWKQRTSYYISGLEAILANGKCGPFDQR
jgi:hypothetical protein